MVKFLVKIGRPEADTRISGSQQGGQWVARPPGYLAELLRAARIRAILGRGSVGLYW